MRRGFTLVELLVAISIIAILSTIGLAIFSGIQSKARDSIRKNDLRALATALEIYYQKKGKYVEGEEVKNCQTDPDPNNNTFYNAIKNYLSDPNSLPEDPSTKQAYCYISENNGLSFWLCAKLENNSDPDINNPASCPDLNYGVTTQ